MRFVERADVFPSRCAVLPQIGQSHPLGFIDTGTEFSPGARDQRCYVSIAALRELAKIPQCGLVLKEDLDAALDAVRSLEDRVEELERELSDAETVIDAVHVLKAKGYSAQRKPGRKAA